MECDKQVVWDALIKGNPLGHLLQSWAWGDIKASFGWQPLRLMAQQGDKVAAAQILFRPLLGLTVAYVPRGPAWSGDPDLDRRLLHAIQERSRSRRAAFLRLEPNETMEWSAPGARDHLPAAGFRRAGALQPQASIILDLQPELAVLHGRLSKGHRADIRRAEREAVHVRAGQGEVDLDAFYALMDETQRRKHFQIHGRAYYRKIWRTFGDDARLLLATHEDQVVAGALVIGWGAGAYYLYAASSEAGLRLRANHLIQWHAIQWAKARGHSHYDLWGIARDAARAEGDGIEQLDAGLSGLYRFKKGWGGSVVVMEPAYDRVYLPPVYWLWRLRRPSG